MESRHDIKIYKKDTVISCTTPETYFHQRNRSSELAEIRFIRYCVIEDAKPELFNA